MPTDTQTERIASPGAPTWGFVCVVAALGALALLQAGFAVLAVPFNPFVLALAGLTIFGGRFSIKIPGRAACVSFSEVFVFTSIVLFGPAPATLTVAIDGLWISLTQQNRRVHRALFNVAEPAVSTWAAGHAFFFVAHVAAVNGLPDVMARVAATLAMAGTYFILNSMLTACAMAIESRVPIDEVWRQHAVYLAINDYAAASLATLLVRHESGIDLQAVGLVVPLLLLSYAAFRAAATRVDEAQQHVSAVEHLYSATIETLAVAVDAKDQVTHGHIRRVQRHTVALARQLGITDGMELKALAAAALLHDVGKLAVPDYVLNKPGRLTGAEFERIKEHAATGASILTTVEFPYPVVPIVRHHHEQWDGRGYPDGLAGTAIPIGARILAVVDCFDALTSDRPYRRRLTDADATAILVERRGVMYDAQVVDAFLALLPDLRCGDESVRQPVLEDSRDTPLSAPTSTRPPDDEVTLDALRREGQSLARILADTLSRSACCVFVPSASGEVLLPVYASPAMHEVAAAVEIRTGEGLSGWVAANRHTIVNSHADLDLGEDAHRLGFTTCTSTPVFALGDLTAVFTVYTTQPLTASEAHTVGRLGQEMGLSVARARQRSESPEASATSRVA